MSSHISIEKSVSSSVAVNQQVHTAMTKLLRLLPLLVVGCLLLQSLQPIATATNDVGEEVCDQAIEGEAITFEDYVWEYVKSIKKAPKTAKKGPTKRIKVNKNECAKFLLLHAKTEKAES